METKAHTRRLWWRHLLAILVLPATMTLVIPALIGLRTGMHPVWHGWALTIGLIVCGGLLIAGGLGMLIWTVNLFDRVGEGTLGIGKVMGEPIHLVVRGPYRHVRNPMISGVLAILLGEAAVTASGWLLGWFVIFVAFQLIGIRFWEEPHLVRRFGDEYRTYRHHVPRWIPRISPWDPSR